jgi:hypothetical protein
MERACRQGVLTAGPRILNPDVDQLTRHHDDAQQMKLMRGAKSGRLMIAVRPLSRKWSVDGVE